MGLGRDGSVRGPLRHRRRMVVVAAALTVGGLIAGCGPELAGSAAVVGQDRVTDIQLSDQVNTVTSALGIPTSAKANQVVLDRLIREELYHVLAERVGVTVTDGEVQKFLDETVAQVGGQKALEDQLLQSGVPNTEIFNFARTFLQQRAIVAQIAPGKSEQEQGQVLGVAIIALSKELDTRVSPRFGTWDAARLSVGAPPNDLSEPLPTENSNLMQVPVPQQDGGQGSGQQQGGSQQGGGQQGGGQQQGAPQTQ